MANGLKSAWMIVTLLLMQAAAAMPTPISIHGTSEIPIDDVRVTIDDDRERIDYVSTVEKRRFLVTITLTETFSERDLTLVFINNESIVRERRSRMSPSGEISASHWRKRREATLQQQPQEGITSAPTPKRTCKSLRRSSRRKGD